MKEYFTKKSPQSTIIKLISVGLIFSFILYFLSGGLPSISPQLWVIWTLFFGFIIYGVFKAAQNKPTLIIHKDGITDNSTINNSGIINWNNIKNIEIRKGVNMTFLCFDLLDDTKILDSVNPIKKLLMKSNKKKLGTICAIPEISLNENLDNILSEINKVR